MFSSTFPETSFFIQNIRGMQDTFCVISKEILLTFNTCSYICESLKPPTSKVAGFPSKKTGSQTSSLQDRSH